MKKTLLLAAFGIFSLAGFAQTSKTYTDDLIVTINDQSTPAQKSNIDFVNHEDGTCDFVLKNFCLTDADAVIPVGNIELKNVNLVSGDSYNTFETEQIITIQPGDDAEKEWIGPMLGEVPIDMQGKINEDQLYCTIDIDMMSTLQQIIKVTFGKDITTGITHVSVTAEKLVDVYTLNGTLLRSRVSSENALNGLQPGIYVVNGKKVVKK
ncbi:calycin-like domain-containing protein [Bacteroides eggerthii]|uniref:Calycin-like domain-containing protein n=1 Tax=Bacteroides eggerthii TaxID=28111 RepID=A0ABT7U4H3_9BACE|nr:calycin-like domain-containing protein [Bacteroides eggerthii]